MSLGALLLLTALALPELVPPAAPTPPVSQFSRAESYTHFLRAKDALSDDDATRAIDEYTQARDHDPTSATVRVELADVLLRVRRYRDAAREAEAAVALEPDSEAALDLLAQIYETTGEIDKAVAALERLVRLLPAQSAYLVRLASLQDRAGHPEEAVKLLEEAVTRDPSATEAVFELVERFQSKGRIDRAIDVLERAATADPDNLYIRSKLAELFVQIRDEVRAKKALDAMVEVAPSNLHMLLEVARAFQQMEEEGRASELYRQALLLKPDDETIRLKLATSLTRAGDFRGALVEYRTLLAGVQASPSDATRAPDAKGSGAGGGAATGETAERTDRKVERYEYLKRIGILELELGDVKAALTALEDARPSSPADDIDFVRALAAAYDRAGDPARGLALYEERLAGRTQGDLRNVELVVGRAAFLILAGRADEGLKAFDAVAETQALDARQLGLVGYALVRRDRLPEAERVLARARGGAEPGDEQRAYAYAANHLLEVKEPEAAARLLEVLLARSPQDRDLYLFLSRIQSRGGAYEQAASVLERGVKALPDDAELRFSFGAVLERLKKVAESDRELEAAVRLDPKHAMAMNYLSYMLAERGEKLERALELARKAVELEPENGAFLDTLGWVYFKLGNLEPARVNLERAAAVMLDDPVVREHLGDVLLRKGEASGAVRAYERAVELQGASTVPPALKEKLERARAAVVPSATAPGAKPPAAPPSR